MMKKTKENKVLPPHKVLPSHDVMSGAIPISYTTTTGIENSKQFPPDFKGRMHRIFDNLTKEIEKESKYDFKRKRYNC